MNIEEFREYCLYKPGVEEEMPFGPDNLVFKVGGKMFALCSLDPFEGANLKCHPAKAEKLREDYQGISPGYHMNKKHWNTVAAGGSVPDSLVRELVDHSYQLVVANLPKNIRKNL